MLSLQMSSCIKEANDWMMARAIKKFGNDSPEARVLKRRFTIGEVETMVGVTRTSIYKAESNGRLPEPDMITNAASRNVRAGYTLDQINSMREVFGTSPHKPNGTQAITISIPGGKGGSWKTATTAHFAQWLSLQGYRVLAIDIDAQAHLSMYFGYHPEINTKSDDTILPYMLGEKSSLDYCIKTTAWPNLNIIPSHLQMQRLESEIQAADLPYMQHQMIQAGLEQLKNDYDVILIDGHPDLGIGTTNMICASDVVLIATSAEVNDINSTCQLMGLISDIYSETGLEHTHEPYVRILPTKLGGENTSSHKNLLDMKRFWGGMPLANGVYFTDEVGKGQRRNATIYEQADSTERSTPTAWKRATEIFDGTFNEIVKDIIKPMWGEE
jgi:chromosome partitioning protein